MAKDISHRVQCSYRIVIGPLDIEPLCSHRTSQDSHHEPNSVQFLSQCNSMSGPTNRNTSSYYVRTHGQSTTKQGSTTGPSNASNNPAPDMYGTVTASTASSASCPQYRQQETLLYNSISNGAMPTSTEQQLTDCGDPQQPLMQPSNDRVIKQDALLCMGSITSTNEKLPTRYKRRDAGSFRQHEDWRQLETVLTPVVLACYDSTALSWPHRTLEHWVSLDSQKDPNLSLYMLSPLDYTFCIQYTPMHAKEPLTLIFRARSFSLCQEWYSSLYQHFPTGARKHLPEQCDIYLPARDLHIHLPLSTDYQHISMDQVKEVVLDLLKEDANGSTLLGQSELLLCWTRKDRAEWVFWNSLVDGSPRPDLIFCPQLIEKDHQLEVRPIQHTPCTIVSSDNMSLQEPPPCEGFLTKVTDFDGRRLKTWAPQRFYFASFGRFLFVIPSDKAIVPDTKMFAVKADGIDSGANAGLRSFFVDWVENDPSVDLITPFASDSEAPTEIRRRSALVAAAHGYIDLTQVAYIQRCEYASPAGQQHGDERIYSDQDSFSRPDSESAFAPLLQHYHPEEDRGSYWYQQARIELVMKNGISILLQASSPHTCDLWVSCLSDLVLYSNAYLEVARYAHGTIDSPRSEGLGTDGTPSSRSPSIDTRLWSLCLYTQCHDVVKSGIMYIQSKGVFSQKQFILTTDGQLHFFSMYKRSGDDGKPIATSLKERKGMLELTGAYVYSGLVSSLDSKLPALLDLPPRLFADGVTTNDSNEDCLFTLWIPKRRRVFSARRQSLIVYGPHQRFPSKGTRWLLLAPSRHEMEHWIWSINVIQEHLLRRCS